MFDSGQDNEPGRWMSSNGVQLVVTRVFRFLPDEQFDGWRLVVSFKDFPVIEVEHRSLPVARQVAADALRQIYPTLTRS